MTKYVIVNETKRINFEKENCLPYGYGNDSCQIYDKYDEALSAYNFLLFNSDASYVLEQHYNGEIEILEASYHNNLSVSFG